MDKDTTNKENDTNLNMQNLQAFKDGFDRMDSEEMELIE